jgi:hypothetical protein
LLVVLHALLLSPADARPPVKLTLRYDEGVAKHRGKALRVRDLKLTASSSLCEKNGFCHRPDRLLDGKNQTAWCEGAPGKGVGEKLVFELGKPRRITTITFLPFYAKNKKAFFDNAQGKELEIKTDEGSYRVAFSVEDPVSTFGGGQLDHSHPYVELPTDPGVKHAITTSRVEILVKAVYPGARFEDLCMSELVLYAE